ncbi:MAG: dihydropteroate synthase [Bradymonadaceae bacterium]
MTPPLLAPVRLGERTLSFGERFYVMGILNVTPDSFSDGGLFHHAQAAIDHGLSMVEQGADILDIGGESTRPGAASVSVEEELDRVIPVIEALASQTDTIISIDTTKARVAEEAAKAGATIINDISGLGFDEAMAGVVASTGAALVLMHIRGTPETMQKDIRYDDVVVDILAYFEERIRMAEAAGVARTQIIVDPGIGFGKTVAQNYRLLRELNRFTTLGQPILLGTSRKSFLGAVVDKPARERIFATAATVACGLMAGADIVRVHDVAEMVDVARVVEAIAVPTRTA